MIIVFDTKLIRPACPILQAVLGGDEGAANHFPTESWLLKPTGHMRAYKINREELDTIKDLVALRTRLKIGL